MRLKLRRRLTYLLTTSAVFLIYDYLESLLEFHMEENVSLPQPPPLPQPIQPQTDSIFEFDIAELERYFRQAVEHSRPADFLPWNASDVLRLQFFREIASIGSGFYGKVHKVTYGSNLERFFARKYFNARTEEKLGEYRTSIIIASLLSSHEKAKLLVLPIECVRRDRFYYLITNIYGHSIYNHMAANYFSGLPLPQIRHIAYQLINAIGALHENGVTHGDIKLENILLVNDSVQIDPDSPKNQTKHILLDTTIRVIDFSFATFIERRQQGSRQDCMRVVPEMDLGFEWSFMADVWNIGSILSKLYRGLYEEIFQSDVFTCTITYCRCRNIRRLACMERILGPYPKELVDISNDRLHANGSVILSKCIAPEELDKKCKPLNTYMRSEATEDVQFFDLLRQMLHHNPDQRINLADALKHPFFDSLTEEQKSEAFFLCSTNR